jgi:hypothetical protein
MPKRRRSHHDDVARRPDRRRPNPWARFSFRGNGARGQRTTLATAQALEPTSVFRFDYSRIRALLDRSTATDMAFAREKNFRYF